MHAFPTALACRDDLPGHLPTLCCQSAQQRDSHVRALLSAACIETLLTASNGCCFPSASHARFEAMRKLKRAAIRSSSIFSTPEERAVPAGALLSGVTGGRAAKKRIAGGSGGSALLASKGKVGGVGSSLARLQGSRVGVGGGGGSAKGGGGSSTSKRIELLVKRQRIQSSGVL
eukprot:914634-Prorocentrum_minimum.AAC.2